MLAELRVRDLALLESVDLTLAPGLNVLSGETGEGKSLLLQAIVLLLGARSRKGLVRSGARQAVVEGRFLIPAGRLSALTDIVEEDAEEVCLRRVIGVDGQSRAYLNGSLCPVSLLGRIGATLVDVHGQRHSLLRPAAWREVLDRFAGLEESVELYRRDRASLERVTARLDRRDDEERERQEKLAFLRFQIGELEDLQPEPGEEAALATRLAVLSSQAELTEALEDGARRLMEGEGAVGESCARLHRRLEDLATGDEQIAVLSRRLEGLGVEAEDLGGECRRLVERLEADPRGLEEVEGRLTEIRNLARRHRVDADDLADRLAVLQEEAKGLQAEDDREADWERAAGELRKTLAVRGREIRDHRRDGARRLEQEVKQGLAELRMSEAVFRVQVEPETWPGSFDPLEGPADGPGPVVFHVASNPGEPPQPLTQVASGGEMARILLALKGALAGAHDIPLLIFDEIDAGVGGRVGLPFGRRIAAIAAHHQVLVVTHLPQVAAFADHHLRVRKEVVEGRTRTHVEVLDPTDRVAELAAMLGGAAQDVARRQARALIKEAAT